MVWSENGTIKSKRLLMYILKSGRKSTVIIG